MSTHPNRRGSTCHHNTPDTSAAIPFMIATTRAMTCPIPVIDGGRMCRAPLCGSALQARDTTERQVLRDYLPAIVFLGIGSLLGALFVSAGSLFGPKRKTKPTTYQRDPYESG